MVQLGAAEAGMARGPSRETLVPEGFGVIRRDAENGTA
jgi:hypothetical protein